MLASQPAGDCLFELQVRLVHGMKQSTGRNVARAATGMSNAMMLPAVTSSDFGGRRAMTRMRQVMVGGAGRPDLSADEDLGAAQLVRNLHYVNRKKVPDTPCGVRDRTLSLGGEYPADGPASN